MPTLEEQPFQDKARALVTTPSPMDSSDGPRNSRARDKRRLALSPPSLKGLLHAGQGQPLSPLTTTDKWAGGTGHTLELSLGPGLGFMF